MNKFILRALAFRIEGTPTDRCKFLNGLLVCLEMFSCSAGLVLGHFVLFPTFLLFEEWDQNFLSKNVDLSQLIFS